MIDWNFIPHIFLLQSWIPTIQPQAYLGPAWFISSLLFCYCASPIAKKITEKGIWAVAVIIGLMYLWKIVGFEHYISPVYRFLEYSIGVWMHRWICNNDQQKELFYGFSPFAIAVILAILHFGVNYWTNILLFLGLIYIVYMFSSPSLKKVLGNRFILQLAKSDIFIYLTHPGIGFHLVFFFICYNPVVATIGSVIVGYVLYIIYKQTIDKIIQAR